MANSIRFAIAALALLMGASCVPLPPPDDGSGIVQPSPPPSPPGQPVGYVANVSGAGNAFIDRGAAHNTAANNQTIYAGDHFYTGDGTTMLVRLNNGATITLEPNVDPSILVTVECIVINLFSGTMIVDGSSVCVDAGANKVIQHSRVVYRAVPQTGSLSVTVLSGSVQTLSGPRYTIVANQTLTLTRGSATSPPRPVNSRILGQLPVKANPSAPVIIQ